jgi:hypothetical protein
MSGEYVQIGGKLQDAAADLNAPEENIQLGTTLRDAAVDPQPGDSRPYTSKGEHVNAVTWPPKGS